jgi:hypothetical protein
MSALQIDDLINPVRLRLGIKRAFTGDINEVLSELFQNSARAGARNLQIITDNQGFLYHDDGRGLRDRSDFEALLKLGESRWDRSVEEEQQPMGLGIHSLLAHEEVESVTFSSNLLSLTLDARRWWTDWQYAAGWADNLSHISFPAPGMNIGVTCSRALKNELVKALTDCWLIYRSPARGYHDLLNITINDMIVSTSVPEDATPSIPLIETSYRNNRLVIGLYRKEEYVTQNGIWVNFFGQKGTGARPGPTRRSRTRGDAVDMSDEASRFGTTDMDIAHGRITEDAVDCLFDFILIRLFPRNKPAPCTISFKREAELFQVLRKN